MKRKVFKGNEQVIVYSKPVVVGFQSPMKGKKKKDIIKKPKTLDECKYKVYRSAKSSSRRSKNKIYDYSRCNDWEWFVTLTFNPDLMDSFDYVLCVKKFSKWLNNIRNRYCKDMVYLFVPELHKSGRYHFHGCISNCGGLEFVDSGHVDKKGRVIYNIGKYKLGFTTATKVGDTRAVNKYIAKYITKELTGMIKGKRRYWHSKNCSIPNVEYFFNERFEKDNMEHDYQMDLHGDLISRSDFVIAQEKEYYDRQGNAQYVRYYEFEEGEAK